MKTNIDVLRKKLLKIFFEIVGITTQYFQMLCHKLQFINKDMHPHKRKPIRN